MIALEMTNSGAERMLHTLQDIVDIYEDSDEFYDAVVASDLRDAIDQLKMKLGMQ